MLMRPILAFSLLIAVPICAQRSPHAPGTGNPEEKVVPWHFLEKGAVFPKAPVVLYWLPASIEETKRSPLLMSHILFDDALRCVNLLIVLPEDSATIAKLGAIGKLPMAVVADGEGKMVRSVTN